MCGGCSGAGIGGPGPLGGISPRGGPGGGWEPKRELTGEAPWVLTVYVSPLQEVPRAVRERWRER